MQISFNKHSWPSISESLASTNHGIKTVFSFHDWNPWIHCSMSFYVRELSIWGCCYLRWEGSLEPILLGYGGLTMLFLVHGGLMHTRHSYYREVVFVALVILILNPIFYFLEMNLMHLLSCLDSVAPASLFRSIMSSRFRTIVKICQ